MTHWGKRHQRAATPCKPTANRTVLCRVAYIRMHIQSSMSSVVMVTHSYSYIMEAGNSTLTTVAGSEDANVHPHEGLPTCLHKHIPYLPELYCPDKQQNGRTMACKVVFVSVLSYQRCKPTHNQGQALKSNVTIRTETSQQQSKVASQIRTLFYILPQQVELFREKEGFCTLRKQPRGNSLCGACTTKDIASKPANTSSTHPGISWLMHESTDCHILHAVGTITSLKHANSLCIMYKVI